MICLHSLQRARLEGASPIEYVLGCVLNPQAFFMIISSLSSLHSAELHSRRASSIAISLASHQLFGSTSAIMRYSKISSLRNQPLETQPWIWGQFLVGS